MSKNEQAKNEQIVNIRTLAEFEISRAIPFFSAVEKLRKDVNELSELINIKREEINAKIELEAAKEYEKALKEMSVNQSDQIAEESLAPINEEEKKETKESKPVENTKAASETVHSTLDIPELKIKSRPKPVKEEPKENKGRVFIPDNTTKPSGQPINRFVDNLPRSRRPNEGEVRTAQPQRPLRSGASRPVGEKRPFTGKTGSKPLSTLRVADVAPVIAPKDIRTTTRKKDDKKGEETKKTMDRRTLIRRGFINNVSPGAVIDYDTEESRHFKARRSRKSEFKQQAIQIEKAVINTEIVPIKILSEKIGKTGAQIIKQLFILGIVKTINESIDFETAELVANELGVELELNVAKTSEDLLKEQFTEMPDDVVLKPRPPVVTIMGHVDHGKTSLLDYIRKANIVQSEAGGITQHIGAYTVEINKEKITFLDTPGHEAFTAMRLRGAQVTDIAIIVVAADDGIMPQTIEAISHAKASKVSIIVAINKMDKKNANPERIKQQLTEHNLLPEEWGGDVICVPVSAVTGEGIDKLLESILLVA